MSKPHVLLIDLSALFHPAWRANEHGPVSVAFDGTIGGVSRAIGIMSSLHPDGGLVAICCDGKGNWRKKISAEYKAKRDRLPDVFYGELARVKDRLRADGHLLWEFDGFEADDVIATAKTAAFAQGHAVTIATHDKDMFQLVTKAGCDVLSLSTWEIRTEADVIAKFGVRPDQMGDFLALVGDASDNVNGCPGCGPVNAAKLLNAFGDLDTIQKTPMETVLTVVGKSLTEKLRENSEAITEARKLVELRRDVPLQWDEIYEKREQHPISKGESMTPDELQGETMTERDIPILMSAQVGTNSVALAGVAAPEVTAVVEYERGLEPRSFKEATILAKHLYNSRLYQKFPNEDAIAAVIVRGRELGLGALTALDCFHVVEGRPYPFAYLLIALCRKHPDCEYLLPIEATPTKVIAETKHRKLSAPIRLEYAIDDAKTAQIYKNAWLKHPEDMLVKTALAKLGRRIYSDAALGLTSLEEIGEA